MLPAIFKCIALIIALTQVLCYEKLNVVATAATVRVQAKSLRAVKKTKRSARKTQRHRDRVVTASGSSSLVALAPNHGDGDGTFQWVNVSTWTDDVNATADISLNTDLSNDAVKELGLAANYTPGGSGLSLTAKVWNETMYALVSNGDSSELDGVPGGCCSNFLEITPFSPASTSEKRSIDLDPIIQKALNTSSAHATHTFHVADFRRGDEAFTLGLFVAIYEEPRLGSGIYASAIVGINLGSMVIVETVTGASAFLPIDEIGTFSTASDESVFKMQYFSTSDSNAEEYHMNGITSFAFQDKSWLAFTHKNANEAVILENPWTSAPTDRFGRFIAQRFGTPALDASDDSNSAKRKFGIDQDDSTFTGVHNLLFTASSKTFGGLSTLCMFVNDRDGNSTAVEFVVDPVFNYTDTTETFSTKYALAPLPYQTSAQGGVAPLGAGVYLVASGSSTSYSGLGVIDLNGEFKYVQYMHGQNTGNFYDPFLMVPQAGKPYKQ